MPTFEKVGIFFHCLRLLPGNRDLHEANNIQTVLRLAPVFARIVEQGNEENVFDCERPQETGFVSQEGLNASFLSFAPCAPCAAGPQCPYHKKRLEQQPDPAFLI
jgi:hypothetical protein